jgi:hypothetical protein
MAMSELEDAMTSNLYVAKLRAELDYAKTRTWQIKRRLDLIAAGHRIGDEVNTLSVASQLQREYIYLDREKARLRHELGLPEPVGAIKLGARAG